MKRAAGFLPSAFANPTAKVGPTVVNGTALTAMRSDAAPPLDLAANFPVTGNWSFGGGFTWLSGAGAKTVSVSQNNTTGLLTYTWTNAADAGLKMFAGADIRLDFDFNGGVYTFYNIIGGKIAEIHTNTGLILGGAGVSGPGGISSLGGFASTFVTQVPVAATTLGPYLHSLMAPVSAVISTATPTFVATMLLDGTKVVLVGSSNTNTFTLQDNATLAGTLLALKASNRILGLYSVLELVWNSTLNRWVEVYYSP